MAEWNTYTNTPLTNVIVNLKVKEWDWKSQRQEPFEDLGHWPSQEVRASVTDGQKYLTAGEWVQRRTTIPKVTVKVERKVCVTGRWLYRKFCTRTLSILSKILATDRGACNINQTISYILHKSLHCSIQYPVILEHRRTYHNDTHLHKSHNNSGSQTTSTTTLTWINPLSEQKMIKGCL